MSELRLNTDGHIIKFGADNDVSLTHVADTGLLLNSTRQLQFNDASQNINAPSATILDINATDEIELNATLVDVNANLDVSGTITSGGVVTGTAFTAGNAVLAEAELELLDGLTAGTAIASKVVTTDANIDSTGMRNLTISGELDAATLDISGASDLAGVLTVSSGQITFPGTQAASTNANTLDDYEEGTWTPACSGSTVGSANGFYTKIGRVCYISLSFSLTAIGSGNPSQISGLPFTQKNATGHHGIISVGDARNQSTGTVDLRLRTDTNTTLLIFVGKEADDTDYDDDLNVMQNGFSVTASGWYCVE